MIGRRYRLSNRTLILLTISTMVGLVVCLEVHSYLKSRKVTLEEPKFLQVRRTLERDRFIHFRDLRPIPKSLVRSEVPNNALTDQDLYLVRGARTLRTIQKNEWLTLESLRLSPRIEGLGPSIPKGFRAYFFTAANQLLLRPGDNVDILMRNQSVPQGRAPLSLILVEGARVLYARAIEESRNTEVIVALKQTEIEFLEEVRQSAQLMVVLRNPLDVPENKKKKYKKRRKRKRPPKIEVIAE